MTIGAPGPDVMEKVIAENKKYLEENIALKKSKEDIPVTGMAVLRQQYTLAEAIEEWIASLKRNQFVKVHGRNKRNAVIF